jgi:hypothetical protein
MSDEDGEKIPKKSSFGAVRTGTGLADALDLETERSELLGVDHVAAVEYQAWSAHDRRDACPIDALGTGLALESVFRRRSCESGRLRAAGLGAVAASV